MQGRVAVHGIPIALGDVIIRRWQDAVKMARQLFSGRVVTAHPHNVSGKGTVPTAKKGSSSRGNQLINHTVKVLVDVVFIIIQEFDIVILLERIEKRFLAFVGRNENCSIGGNNILNVFEDFLRFNAGVLVLKVSSADTGPNNEILRETRYIGPCE
jgi:hypothetical protein